VTSFHGRCHRAEARGGLHIVEQSLWAAVPAYLRKLSAALQKHCGRPLPMGCVPVTFASWMGGDRDGNPTVTAKAGLCLYCRLIDVGRTLVHAGTRLAHMANAVNGQRPVLSIGSERWQRKEALLMKQSRPVHGA